MNPIISASISAACLFIMILFSQLEHWVYTYYSKYYLRAVFIFYCALATCITFAAIYFVWRS